MSMALGVAVAIAIAPSASAKLIYKQKSATIAPDGAGPATAKCPRGSKVLSGGSSNDGAPYAADVSVLRPADGPDANSKRDDAWTAVVDNYETDPIEITTYAICGKDRRGERQFKGKLKYVSERKSSVASSTQGGVTAECPAGTRVVGGGASHNGGLGGPNSSTWINTTRPEDGPDGNFKDDDAWGAYIDHYNFGTTVDITAHAVCIAGKYKRGLRYRRHVSEDATGDGGSTYSLFVGCGSRHVVGGGAENSGGYQHGAIAGVLPLDGSDGDSKPDDEWQADITVALFYTDDLYAYAICHA